MINLLQNKTIGALQTAIDKLEQYDDNSKRQPYFAVWAAGEVQASDNAVKKYESKSNPEEKTPTMKIKDLSCELLDIGLHQGQKNLSIVKETNAYSKADQIVHFDEKAEVIFAHSAKVYTYLNDKVYYPLRDKFLIIYEQGTDYISFLIKVLSEH
jgi:hypothetical protein